MKPIDFVVYESARIEIRRILPTTQCHVSWALAEFSDHQKLNVLKLQIGRKLKKLEGYFSGGENKE